MASRLHAFRLGLKDSGFVVAEAGAAALVGGEQAAQHADGCGLARAIGTKEAVNLARA